MSYTPTEFSSAADKVKFREQFKKFVSNGFKRRDFPKWFYTRLSLTFMHIAHYNQMGFYHHWFDTVENQRAFIEFTLDFPCYGDPSYTFSDVEEDIQQWLKDNPEIMENLQ